MLYIISFPTRKPGYIRYKVGYASDVHKRFLQYGPEACLVGTRQGFLHDEQILHKRLKLLSGVIILRDEWYIVKIDDDRIIKAFHEPRIKTEKLVWENCDLSELSYYSWIKVVQQFGNPEGNLSSDYSRLSKDNSYSKNIRKYFKLLSKSDLTSRRIDLFVEASKKLSVSDFSILIHSVPDYIDLAVFLYNSSSEEDKKYYLRATDLDKKLDPVPGSVMVGAFIKVYLYNKIRSEFSDGEVVSIDDFETRLKTIFEKIGYSVPNLRELKSYFKMSKISGNKELYKIGSCIYVV